MNEENKTSTNVEISEETNKKIGKGVKGLIAAAILGGGYLLYSKVIKPRLNKNTDDFDEVSNDNTIVLDEDEFEVEDK